MINNLTNQQEALLNEMKQEALAKGRSIEPANRELTEKAILKLYDSLDLKAPKIIWLSSPLGGCAASALLSRDQLRGQLGDQLWGQLRDQLRDQLWGQLRDQPNKACYGQHDLYWIDFYRFLNSIVSNKLDATLSLKLDLIHQIACNLGWYWPYAKLVILTDRPEKLSLDSEGKLHCLDGPAFRYRDGWEGFYKHGERWNVSPLEQLALS